MGGTEKAQKRLFSMTCPIVAELLLTGLISTGSSYLLNRYSQDAVAVVGSLSQIVTLVVNLYTIISVGGSVVLAPMVGAGRNRESGKLIKTLLYSNLVCSAFVSLITVGCVPCFMKWMHIDPSLYAMGREYLLASFGFSAIQSLLTTYVAIFRSFGRMKDVMVGNFMVYLVCLGVNALIAYGIPPSSQCLFFYTMAGIIGQACGVIYLHWRLGHVFWKENSCGKLHRGEGRYYLQKVFRFGTLGGLEGIFYLIVQAMVIAMVGTLGTQTLLVKAYLATFAGYMVICDSALGTAVFPLTGQQLGEKDYKGLRRTHRDGVLWGIVLTTAIGGILILFSRPILLCFTAEETVIRQVQHMLWIQLALEVLRVPVNLLVVGLKGVGEVKIPFLIMVAAGMVNVILSWLFGIHLQMGLPGIWIGYFGDLLLRLTAGGYFMLKILNAPEKYLERVMK